jgi:hypothetical protein
MRTKLLSGTGLLALPFIVLMMGPAVSGRPNETAKKPANAYSDPIKIDTGLISGTVIGDAGKEVHIYRGIPYAAPPVGELRWKPPQPAAPWQGIRQATAFGKICPQDLSQYLPMLKAASMPADVIEAQMGEDCLSINVLTPAKGPTTICLSWSGCTAGAMTWVRRATLFTTDRDCHSTV